MVLDALLPAAEACHWLQLLGLVAAAKSYSGISCILVSFSTFSYVIVHYIV